jgi:hypothetical protein
MMACGAADASVPGCAGAAGGAGFGCCGGSMANVAPFISLIPTTA